MLKVGYIFDHQGQTDDRKAQALRKVRTLHPACCKRRNGEKETPLMTARYSEAIRKSRESATETILIFAQAGMKGEK